MQKWHAISKSIKEGDSGLFSFLLSQFPSVFRLVTRQCKRFHSNYAINGKPFADAQYNNRLIQRYKCECVVRVVVNMTCYTTVRREFVCVSISIGAKSLSCAMNAWNVRWPRHFYECVIFLSFYAYHM